MIISEEQAEEVVLALHRMQRQGLSPELTEQAQECTDKIFVLLAEYGPAALVALGIVTGVIDGKIRAGEYTLIKP
jgi:hypothetical protein